MINTPSTDGEDTTSTGKSRCGTVPILRKWESIEDMYSATERVSMHIHTTPTDESITLRIY